MDSKQEEEPKPAPEPEQTESETVLLRDLAPRAEVKGGAGKLRFGESKAPEVQDDS